MVAAHRHPGQLALALLPLVLAGTLASGAAEVPGGGSDPLFDDTREARAGFPDPFERVNRDVFALNQRLDRWLFDPLTRVYEFVVPGPARRGVRNALANLGAPAVFVNNMLQLEPLEAGVTATRFVLNSTVGGGGLVDAATMLGLERRDADFGQTLALVGVPSGPFLILPAVGPTTLRDGAGHLIDVLFQPATYVLPFGFLYTPQGTLALTGIKEGSLGFTTREVHAEELNALERSSMDFYAALRNAYYQDRMAFIWADPPWWAKRPAEDSGH